MPGGAEAHSWNNSLSHATFEDNVESHGKETALQLLREDIRSWIRERKGQSHQWSLYVRDGQMITQTGVSLQEMTDNITSGPHSDIVPENIKATAPLEAATLHEATKLAISGAQRIVFPEQHLDASGKVVSRYLSVWTKNASDPTRYDGTRIDLGKNVRVEDVRTGTSFVAFGLHENVVYHEHRKQKHAFVLEAKADSGKPFEVVEKAIVATIRRSHQETYSYKHRTDTLPKDERSLWKRLEVQETQSEVLDQGKILSIPVIQKDRHTDVLIDIPRTVVRDTADTVRGVAIFLRKKELRRETNAPSIVRKDRLDADRLTLEKIREKPMKIAETIEKRHVEMQRAAAALGVMAETAVAVHAAPVFLAALAEKLPPAVRAVEKSLRRHQKRVMRIKNYEVRKAKREAGRDRVKVQLLKTERIKSIKTATEGKKRKKSTKMFEARISLRRKELLPKRERRHPTRKDILVVKHLEPIRLRPSEKKRMQKILRRVMRGIKVTGERPRTKRKEKKRQIETQFQSTPKKEIVSAPRFIFAWVVFLLLRTSDRKPQNELGLSLKRQEVIVKKEPRVWILLSIIWYLAMIRESGRGSKRHQPLLPVQGVIFVASS